MNETSAQNCAAASRFDHSRLPKSIDALWSTSRCTVSSRSSAYFLMNGCPVRAVTFQSIARTSSPGW